MHSSKCKGSNFCKKQQLTTVKAYYHNSIFKNEAPHPQCKQCSGTKNKQTKTLKSKKYKKSEIPEEVFKSSSKGTKKKCFHFQRKKKIKILLCNYSYSRNYVPIMHYNKHSQKRRSNQLIQVISVSLFSS